MPSENRRCPPVSHCPSTTGARAAACPIGPPARPEMGRRVSQKHVCAGKGGTLQKASDRLELLGADDEVNRGATPPVDHLEVEAEVGVGA